MVNKGKRIGDSKKKKEVKSITFFHNPNDGIALADPVQQFDILEGVEKEKKVRPKDVFENYTDNNKRSNKKPKKKKPLDKSKDPNMNPNQERGKKRGLEKKQEKKKGGKK